LQTTEKGDSNGNKRLSLKWRLTSTVGCIHWNELLWHNLT